MNHGMTELNLDEAAHVSGGNPIAISVSLYLALLKKIEDNPSDYTWMMDWYYE